eukprot:contig_33547_g8104
MAAPGSAKGGVPRSFVSPESRELLPRAKLIELLQEVAPGETLDADVEEFLQEHADEFVESVTLAACRLARHRKSKTLDARDVALHLSRSWSLRVPGYGDDPRPAGRGGSGAGGGLGGLAAAGGG